MSPDILATILMAAAVLLAVLAICTVEPGCLPRYVRARRYHRSGSARHAMRAVEPASLSALETVPDPVVSPFAARAI